MAGNGRRSRISPTDWRSLCQTRHSEVRRRGAGEPCADLPKYGTWSDLPLAIILLQASGYLPDLPDHKEDYFILIGEMGIHGEAAFRVHRRSPAGPSRASRSSSRPATREMRPHHGKARSRRLRSVSGLHD